MSDQSVYLPHLSDQSLDVTVSVRAMNASGEWQEGHLATERPLTIYLDKRELVTLMTMGSQPELLVLGWLRNQKLVDDLSAIKAIQVDWETESCAITTFDGIESLNEKIAHKTVTTGCGQGTMYDSVMDDFDRIKLPGVSVKQSLIYDILRSVNQHNDIYKRAGGVHGCALCAGEHILSFVEDVGRHNAVDALAGYMWLNHIAGADKVFYTTGRLTSEMVIKVANMGIPVVLSRSGATHMGLELAKQVGVVLIARAKGKHFMVYNGHSQIIFNSRKEE